jgi:small subunit ribosomal protein S1
VNDARDVMKVGDAVTARVSNVDRKTRSISISVRQKDEAEQAEAMKGFSASSVTSNTLGDLLKGQI